MYRWEILRKIEWFKIIIDADILAIVEHKIGRPHNILIYFIVSSTQNGSRPQIKIVIQLLSIT